MKLTGLRISPLPVLACLPLLAVSSLLTGCTNMVATAPSVPIKTAIGGIKGNVHGGRGPVVGANVYLYSPSLTGYGGSGIAASTLNASTPLLSNSVPSTCGAGATATAVVDTNPADSTYQQITAINVVTGGAGYYINGVATPPTVTITDPTGTGATATANLGATPNGSGTPTSGWVQNISFTPGSGYTAPVVTITPSSTSACQDANGNYYVNSDQNGNFALSGDYTCTAGLPVYAYTTGGDAGSGAGGDGAFMSVLGICPASGNFATTLPYVNINELTTVAAAYALAGFATNPTHIGVLVQTSASTALQTLETTDLTNAFNNASNIYNVGVQQYSAPTATVNGAGILPNTKLNTLADILANCVDSVYVNFACETLLSYTPGQTDTAGAAIYIAQHPSSNAANIFALATANGSPWQPMLTTAPSDWSLTVNYVNANIAGTTGLAVDNSGNVWLTSNTYTATEQFSPTGAYLLAYQAISGSTNYWASPYGMAIDTSGNLYFNASGKKYVIVSNPTAGTFSYINYGNTQKTQIAVDGNGHFYSPSYYLSAANPYIDYDYGATPTYYEDGLTSAFLNTGYAVAIDTNNVAWMPSDSPSSTTNTPLLHFIASSSNGLTDGHCTTTNNTYTRGNGVAIDHSNNVWISDGYTGDLVEFSNGCVYSNYYKVGTTLNGVAVDGASNIFAMTGTGGLAEVSNTGTLMSESGGFATGVGGTLSLPAVDGSGDVWFASSNNTISEMIGVATPVVTPIAAGITAKTLGYVP
jgi:hypothetical protein